MVYFTILIAVVTCVILLLFFSKQTTVWEYALILVPTIIIVFAIKTIIVSVKSSDVEYRGSYSVGIKYYEKWDEWIHKTCSYTTRSGKTTITHHYDCSYCKTHYPRWVMIDNDGNEINISKDEYNRLLKLWNTKSEFIDMNRHYYRIDGDAYFNAFDEVDIHAVCLTSSSYYENKIKASESIFNFEKIAEKEVVKYNLYDYPDVSDSYQPTILAHHRFSRSIIKKWDYLNAYYGKKYQFRCYLMFFYNKDLNVVNKQMSYWKGPNKNEMLIMVGVDSSSMKVKWCDVKSWSDYPSLEVHTRDFVMSQQGKQLNINSLYYFLKAKIPSEWHRKQFKDFDYITVELSESNIFWITIITLIYVIGMSLFVVLNKFTN